MDGISHRAGNGALADDVWLSEQPDDIGRGWSAVQTPSTPRREAVSQRRIIRSVAFMGVVLSAAYLVWRLVFTIEWAAWFVAIPLVLLELLHAVGLGLSTFSMWDVDPVHSWRVVDATGLRVALLVDASQQNPHLLIPSIAAAVAVGPAHETWVLDSESRPEVEALAGGIGAHYAVGSIDDLIERIEVDLIGILGPDEVVSSEFLANTLGYFDDPRVAVVQVPVVAFGPDGSVTSSETGPDLMSGERIVAAARNRWNAARWTGSGSVMRVAALTDAGPIEDFTNASLNSSVRLHRNGWRIVVHGEVLVSSLDPPSPAREAALALLKARRDHRTKRAAHVGLGRGLALPQRLAYLADGWARFDGIRSLFFFGVPLGVVATGVVPVSGDLRFFAPLMVGVAFVQYAGLRLLARGQYPTWRAVVFDGAAVWSVVPSLSRLIRSFQSRISETDHRSRPKSSPALLLLLMMSVAAGLAWAALTFSGFTVISYPHPWPVYGTAVVLAIELTLLVAATQRVVYPSFGAERRAAVRVDVDLLGRLEDHTVRVDDLSLGGARLWLGAPVAADPWSTSAPAAFTVGDDVVLELPHQGIAIEARVARIGTGERNKLEVGVEFRDGQWAALHQVALIVFHDHVWVGRGLVREHIQLLRAG